MLLVMWITTCFGVRKVTSFYQFLLNILFYKRSPKRNLSTTPLVINDQFFTLLMVKISDIPYSEVKYCYKLSNKVICMLFNITKQLT